MLGSGVIVGARVGQGSGVQVEVWMQPLQIFGVGQGVIVQVGSESGGVHEGVISGVHVGVGSACAGTCNLTNTTSEKAKSQKIGPKR